MESNEKGASQEWPPLSFLVAAILTSVTPFLLRSAVDLFRDDLAPNVMKQGIEVVLFAVLFVIPVVIWMFRQRLARTRYYILAGAMLFALFDFIYRIPLFVDWVRGDVPALWLELTNASSPLSVHDMLSHTVEGGIFGLLFGICVRFGFRWN
jgi:hypothetical protein